MNGRRPGDWILLLVCVWLSALAAGCDSEESSTDTSVGDTAADTSRGDTSTVATDTSSSDTGATTAADTGTTTATDATPVSDVTEDSSQTTASDVTMTTAADTDTTAADTTQTSADTMTDTGSDGAMDMDMGMPGGLPLAGNPNGGCSVPAEGMAKDASTPDVVVGDGTPASCTSTAFVSAVAQGGVITFDCGPMPHTIELDETAKVFNDTGPEIVIDGGGLITLSGQGQRRILYMNTCDQEQVWTTAMCQNQDHPRLTVQNLTFVDGDASGEDPYGGGAIFVRGGRFSIVNSRFFSNRCDDVGPDVGGAAVRVLSQYEGEPVYVVNSTFGGAPGLGNICSNGGGLSSIGVSYTVLNSVFTHNEAIGNGANPAQPGTPGGGSGGAIYNDGNTFTLTVCGSVIEDNTANEGGGAIFFVSNDRTGNLVVNDSTLQRNPSGMFETYPGIFYLGDGDPDFTGSTIQ